MRSSLTWQVALLLAVPSCGAFASLLLFWDFHAHSLLDAVSLADHQRFEAAELGDWAKMVGSGQQEDRTGLLARTQSFDRTLTLLQDGGEFQNRRIPSSIEITDGALGPVREAWRDLEPRLTTLATHPVDSAEFDGAREGLESAIGTFQQASEGLERGARAHVLAARVQLLRVLAAAAALSLALLMLGLWYARRFILQPILQIESAARRIQSGDLTARAGVSGGGELPALAHTFDEMAARVQELLLALDLRRQHAETLAKSLPLGTALLNADLAVVQTNRKFRELFGLGENGNHGRPIEDILGGAALRQRLSAVVLGGDALRDLELPADAANGRSLRVTATVTRPADEGERTEEARLLLVVQDLTQEERLRAEVHVAQARLDHLVQASSVVFYSMQPGDDVGATYVSGNVEQLLGHRADAFRRVPSFWAEQVHPDERPRALAALSHLPDRGHLSMEYRFRHDDGSYRWMRDERRLLRNAEGEPSEIVGCWFDVTERKQGEERQQLLLRAIEQGANAVIITNAAGQIEYVNPRFTRTTGYTQEEVLGKNPRILRSGETPDTVYADMWRTILAGEDWRGTICNKKKDGSNYWESSTISPVLNGNGVLTHFVAVKEDITERIRVEKDLRLFRALIDQSNDAFEVIDATTGRFLDVNERACRDLGYTREEYVELRVPDVDPTIDEAKLEGALRAARLRGMLMRESVRRRKDGSTFPVEVNLAYVGIDRGYLVSIVRDISERKQAERARREDEERYRALFDNAPIGLGIVDADGRLLTSNHALLASAGGAGEVRDLAELYPDDSDRARVFALFEALGRLDREEVAFERKDGSHYPALLTLRPVVVAGASCALVMAEDISDRRALETQMRAAQKLEALGRLAGGVAHDFNNLLTVIISYAGFVRDELRQEDPRREDIAEVLRAADSAASLTQHLLDFSRRSRVELGELDLGDLILDLDKMLRRLIGEDIELVSETAADLWNVHVDPRLLEQVVVNLAVNARDAMPTGGRLTIALENVTATQEHADAPRVPPGEYVMLTVTDTGCGMDEATQDRIFEPFFTTKEKGKGTGLGLATCYGIVKQFDGYLRVESRLGHGAAFHVYLPRFAGTLGKRRRPSVPLVDIAGTETVLVVEDQRAVRELSVRALSRSGFRVLEAEDGEAALRVLDEQAASIDLLLTDVVMPKMSGTQLASHFRERCPHAKVLLMSGYTDEAANRHGVLESGHALLQKPFMPNALLLRVRKILDETVTPRPQVVASPSQAPPRA